MEQFTDNASTTLGAAITDTTGTSITVASSSGFPSSGTFRILIDSELLKVTAISGTTWTVVRGDGGTTAATHLNASAVNHILTADAVNALVSIQSAGTETSNRRVLNFIGATVADNPTNSRCDITVSGATYGPASSRPTAGQAGRIYIPSDPGIITSVDTGSTWVGLNPCGVPFTIPPTSGNWTEFNSTGLTVNDIPGGGLGMIGKLQSGDNAQGIFRSISNSSSYTLIGCISIPGVKINYLRCGLILSDGTKYIAFGFDANVSGLSVNTASGFTVGPTGLISDSTILTPNPIWLKIVNNGVNRNFYFSADGYTWVEFYSQSYNTYLVESYGGVYVDTNNGGVTQSALTVLSWSGN